MRKKTVGWLIFATVLILIGCLLFAGVMTALHWDFAKLSTVTYETTTYDITDAYRNVTIVTDTADIVFVASESDKTSIVCYEQTDNKHAVAVNEDTLVIELMDTTEWQDYIGVNFDSPTITVSVPQGDYGSLSIKTSTGDIDLENVSADTLDLSVTTGDVTVTAVQCRQFQSSGNTGEVSLKNVIAEQNFTIKRSTGDVTLDGCDAADMDITTDTGDVDGRLLSDKVFFVQTSTGDIDVPETTTGGRCAITTSTGDITIVL